MKKRVFLFSMVAIFMLGVQNIQAKKKIAMTKTELLNKIKGGWAAQTIGCTYGGPTEFVYQSPRAEWRGTTTVSQDYTTIYTWT